MKFVSFQSREYNPGQIVNNNSQVRDRKDGKCFEKVMR